MENLPNNNETEYDDEILNNDELPEDYKPPDAEPIIGTRIFIDHPYLIELRSDDFDIKSRTMIDLKNKDDDGSPINGGNWFILFHDESQTSRQYLKIWLQLARTVRDDKCKVAHCNLAFEKKIYNNFLSLSNRDNINNPFSWAKYLEAPFMMVYRDTWPQGFYNGSTYLSELVDFCIDVIGDDSLEISKKHMRRKDIKEEVLNRDREILKDLARERKIEKIEKEREYQKNLDTREQTIAQSVDFLS